MSEEKVKVKILNKKAGTIGEIIEVSPIRADRWLAKKFCELVGKEKVAAEKAAAKQAKEDAKKTKDK